MNISKGMACVAALLTAVPAAADDAGPVLWGSIRAGMTKAEVKAVQPDKKVQIDDRCGGQLGFDYEAKRLKAVRLWADMWTADGCNAVVLKSMFMKYGADPSTARDYSSNDCGYGKLANLCRALGGEKVMTTSFYTWVTRDLIIRLQLNDADGAWSVTYSANPQISQDTLEKF